MLYDEVTLKEITMLGQVMAAAAEQSQLTTDLDRVLLLTGSSWHHKDSATGLVPRSPPRDTVGMSDVLADVAERLMAEFEGSVSPCVVTAVVCEVDRDLSGVTAAEARAELLERSARQRLATRTT